jgi:thiol-disulfide isomerase/thioredoxin
MFSAFEWFIIISIIMFIMYKQQIDYCNLPLGVWVIVGGISGFIFMDLKKTENFINDNAKPDVLANKKKIKVYNFYTSWCGWSKKFLPEWEIFKKQVNKGKTDKCDDNMACGFQCDNEGDAKAVEMCKKYNVPGYPFIIIEVDGQPKTYDGERTSAALSNYIQAL